MRTVRNVDLTLQTLPQLDALILSKFMADMALDGEFTSSHRDKAKANNLCLTLSEFIAHR